MAVTITTPIRRTMCSPKRIETLKIVLAHDATVFAELLEVAHFGLSAKAYRPATNVMRSAFL